MSRTAAYLRFYPADTSTPLVHQAALRAYADTLALPYPTVYLDDGLSWRCPLPAYERLLEAVRSGWHDAVLIPGPWVFALPDDFARARMKQLAYYCRVLELPRARR
ncbi:hypothetical protein ACIGXA_08400 [Streptomyces fildesensis]|uniref:Resolvase/invertase-type recombinase catalytic domain-containing protein n=1 Tax=Streptomyces fildesensis TaxID=375757 RepID=A0ABW8C280_9ACTN